MSDSPQLPPVTSVDKKVTVTEGDSFTPGQITTTSTETHGFPDLIPTLIPALQSSSYVLIILVAFAAWSSRKLARTFFDRHLELMSTVKDSLEVVTQANAKHVDIMEQLTENNRVMAHTLEVSAEARAMRESRDS